MWIVCITSVRHVLTVNGYGGRQTKENEKSWCFKGWETLVCYLIKMQLSIKKIAFIMHITSSGVSQCRRRLYKKFTGEPQNTEKFDKFIADF